MDTEEVILQMLDQAHKKRLSALVLEQTALEIAKRHFGTNGLAKLVGDHKGNISHVFAGRRSSRLTLDRLRKALEKQRKVDG